MALTTIANAGIVFYKIDFANADDVRSIINKIRGAINLGIEAMQTLQADINFSNYILALA